MKTKPPSMLHFSLFAASLSLSACSDDAGSPGGITVPTPTREVHCAPDASVASTTSAAVASAACDDRRSTRS